MLNEERQRAKTSIQQIVTEFSGETRWGTRPHDEVIKLGADFCDELMNMAETLEDERKVRCTSLFSNLVLVFVAETRYYEGISDEELEAIGQIFGEMEALRDEFLEEGFTDIMFDKIMFIREIFLTNTVCREDYDCRYRQGMPYPNFIDLYEIVHAINANWEKLCCNNEFMKEKTALCEMRHQGMTADFDGGRTRAHEFLNLIDGIVK